MWELFASANPELAEAAEEERRERLEAEIRADLEYGR